VIPVVSLVAVSLLVVIRHREKGLRTLAFRALSEDCEWLLQRYKHLDHDHRDLVRHPLSRSSWPEYGKQWGFVDAELYSLHAEFSWLRQKVEAVKKERALSDWNGCRFFRLNESSRMLDVIDALGEMKEHLQRQYK
jgi:hypothetical protein